MNPDILQELVERIIGIMESKIVSIILYGSVARGTYTDESDVDVTLLMSGTLDHDAEEKLSEIIADMNLKYDRVFSVWKAQK